MTKHLIGTVTSASMQKTVVVKIDSRMPHPTYKKIITMSKKMKAHCEDPGVTIGSKVEIVSCRPISKTKNYKVVKIIV